MKENGVRYDITEKKVIIWCGEWEIGVEGEDECIIRDFNETKGLISPFIKREW